MVVDADTDKVLGATLVGLGTILIIAHNWDDLGRTVKTVFAFIPLLAAQLACWFALYRKPEKIAWRESASVFLVLSVGACMAMVSQIFNLGGELSDFLLVWIAVCIPVVYVMNSGMAAVLSVAGITWYGSLVGYEHYPTQKPWMYLLLMATILPFTISFA